MRNDRSEIREVKSMANLNLNEENKFTGLNSNRMSPYVGSYNNLVHASDFADELHRQ